MCVFQIRGKYGRGGESADRERENIYGQHYKIQVTIEELRTLDIWYNPKHVSQMRVNTDRAEIHGIWIIHIIKSRKLLQRFIDGTKKS